MTSTSYPRDADDWRGIFIFHMAAALARAQGIELRLWAPPGEIPPNMSSATSPREAEWLAGLMEEGGISHRMRKHPIAGMYAAAQLLCMLGRVYRREADAGLYHVNWLQCALPLPNDHKPALITVLGNDMKLLEKPLVRRALRRVMRTRKVAICPNAQWMETPLRSAFSDIAEITPVPFGIDPRWYSVERDIGGRPPCWLAVTRLTADKLGSLFEWSQPLFVAGTREMHLFGPMQESIPVPPWVHYHGAATPERLSAEWFPRAHGLITLSRHAEGRPQVMLEAMAAGLPIIASRMPAHADIVGDDVTGAMCDSPDDYERALTTLEDVPANLRMGAAARAWVTREIGTWDDCAARYVRIYRRLLGCDGDG